MFEQGSGGWRIAAGTYRIAVGSSAESLALAGDARLAARVFGR
jgi:hypothetical protein